MYMKPISKSANLIIDILVGVGAWQHVTNARLKLFAGPENAAGKGSEG